MEHGGEQEAQKTGVSKSSACNKCVVVGKMDEGFIKHVFKSHLPNVMMDVMLGGAIL